MLRYPETAYLVSDEEFDRQLDELGWSTIDTASRLGMYVEVGMYNLEKKIRDAFRSLLELIIAAASLLHWAEDARMSSRSPEAIQEAFYSWYDGLTDSQQEGFAEAWPLIKDAALDLLSDKDSMTGRIEDAGLDAKELPGCSEENWKALADVIDVLVPASSE